MFAWPGGIWAKYTASQAVQDLYTASFLILIPERELKA